MSAVIELRDINKKFGDVHAVKDFNLAIEQGEIISLLGPSGCGKTTTLRMIAGFETPSSGRILLHNEDIVARAVRNRNITMVFQNYALFPHMTVFDNIAFGLHVRHARKDVIAQKVKRLLAVVEMEGYEQRKPSQLSGGQQQRVALARALITDPEVILLDEPFGALDKQLRETMQLELRSILRSVNITAVFVTHDQEEALVLSDRIVVMNDGGIEQVASPKELYEHPDTLFTVNFIGISNNFFGKVVRQADVCCMQLANGDTLRFQGPYEEYADESGQCIVSIRPERICIAQDGENSDNMLHGKVADIKYLGTMTQYYIDIGLEKPLIVDSQNAVDAPLKQAGDAVCLQIPMQQLRLIRADKARLHA